MLKTILIDDERPALKALEYLLKRYPDVEIRGTFTEPDQARKILQDHIDLVFLDIDMPKQNGIDFAKQVIAKYQNTQIIFVTAYSHFAVEAFEINALDYIMKPVSPKRLDKTMDRILHQQQEPDFWPTLEKRSRFLNDMLAEKITDKDEIVLKAKQIGIDFTQSFSLFVVLLMNEEKQIVRQMAANMQTSIELLLKELSADTKLVIWKTLYGICLLDFGIAAGNCKQKELARAEYLKKSFTAEFPHSMISVGIAEHGNLLENFTKRYIQARNSAGLGPCLLPKQGVYHFSDNILLPLLDQYVNQQDSEQLISRTIGKILEYDRQNNADLFPTLEAIILNSSLQDVARKLFIHYKTVQFRKQNIEKILGTSLHSFAGRTVLGVALTLFYLRNLFYTKD